MAPLAAIASFLSVIFTKQAAAWVVRMMVFKMLISTALFFIIPMLMVYVWYFLKWEMLDLISETVLPIVMDHLPNSDMVFELTGIAAYLGNKLRIVDIFATVLSGLILTFAISAIKK